LRDNVVLIQLLVARKFQILRGGNWKMRKMSSAYSRQFVGRHDELMSAECILLTRSSVYPCRAGMVVQHGI